LELHFSKNDRLIRRIGARDKHTVNPKGRLLHRYFTRIPSIETSRKSSTAENKSSRTASHPI
jgi:hypothetical protein